MRDKAWVKFQPRTPDVDAVADGFFSMGKNRKFKVGQAHITLEISLGLHESICEHIESIENLSTSDLVSPHSAGGAQLKKNVKSQKLGIKGKATTRKKNEGIKQPKGNGKSKKMESSDSELEGEEESSVDEPEEKLGWDEVCVLQLCNITSSSS